MLTFSRPHWALAATLIVVLAADPVMSQTGEDALRLAQRDLGSTPRTLGLAGVAAGGIGDWGGAVVNPAALALVGVSHVSGSLDLSSVQSDPASGSLARVTRFAPGHGAYVVKLPTVQGSLVVGVGAHRATTLDRRLFYSSAGTTGGSRVDLYESGYVGELSAVGAFEVAPSIYVGASFNALFGDYAFSQFSTPGDASQSWSLDANLRGFNVRGGMVAEVMDGLSIGLALESPAWIYSEETVRTGGTPQFVNWTAQTPLRATGGVVYRVDRFLFAVDMAFSNWSQTRLRPSSRYAQDNRLIQEDFRETADLRIGGEYEFGLGAFRAGYGFAMDPLRDEVETDRIRHTFGTGLSFYLRRGITLDAGVAYTQFEDQLSFEGTGTSVRETVGMFRSLVGLQVNL